jgi:N-methylhydantoinase B
MTMAPLNPITAEVIRHALVDGVAAMKQTVLRTAYSRLWKEAGDVSCGLLDRSLELVAQGVSDIPVHLGAMPLSVQGAVDAIGMEALEPGDILWHNDPYAGNNHLPDLIMIKPIFAADEIVAFSAVRGHFIDIGGAAPGSNAPVVYDLHAEGFRLRPTKIYRAGALNEDILAVFLANTRNPTECLGDFRAQYAACLLGEARVLELVEKYGVQTTQAAMQQLLLNSERLVRSRIAAIPDGRYEFIDYMDDDGVGTEMIRVCAALTVAGDNVTVDLTGSAAQVSGAMNCPYSVTYAAVNYAIKTYLCQDPENPPNSGCYRPVSIIAPPGTVVNCTYPAPVSAGNTDAGYRVLDAVMGAIAQALPERAVATGNGGSCCITIAGDDTREDAPAPGRRFNWLEPNGSAHGGSTVADGSSGVRWGIGNTGNTPVEVVETNEPLFVEELTIACDAGGAGIHRGGNPIRRRIRVLVDSAAVLCMERITLSPWGLAGGREGSRGELWREESGGNRVALPSKTAYEPVAAGEVIGIQMAGGGGFGNPLARDPESVRADVEDGYVSVAAARNTYGVALEALAQSTPSGRFVVDGPETTARRGRMRSSAVVPSRE